MIIDLGPFSARLGRMLDVIVGMPLIRFAGWWFDFPREQWVVRADPAAAATRL